MRSGSSALRRSCSSAIARLMASGMSFLNCSVHNIHEQPVFDAVARAAARFPVLASSSDLLADVACVALNRVSARYIRHDVDLAFFLTERERIDNERLIAEAVDYAFEFVQARHAMAARR